MLIVGLDIYIYFKFNTSVWNFRIVNGSIESMTQDILAIIENYGHISDKSGDHCFDFLGLWRAYGTLKEYWWCENSVLWATIVPGETLLYDWLSYSTLCSLGK